MNIFGINVWSIIVAVLAIGVSYNQFKVLVGLVTGHYDEDISRYRITKFSYAYFFSSTLLSIVFAISAGLHYSMKFSSIETGFNAYVYDVFSISLILSALERIMRKIIDKKYR